MRKLIADMLDEIESEYGMPAIDVIRGEAQSGRYGIKTVARDLGMSDPTLRKILSEHGIEWNRTKRNNSVDMPQYTLRIDV